MAIIARTLRLLRFRPLFCNTSSHDIVAIGRGSSLGERVAACVSYNGVQNTVAIRRAAIRLR